MFNDINTQEQKLVRIGWAKDVVPSPLHEKA